tara:strand:+ start:127 stop:1917 length:1791 start_codon:yes stop_codon:yes gene_type:complete
MLAFALQQESKDLLATDNVYDILSTPGNSIFTASFHTLLGSNSFKFMHLIFQSLAFLFIFLLVDHFTGKYIISIITALFSIFNPYMLSVEVLDRNFLVLVIAVILFYTLFKYKDKIVLHGLLLGVISGLGLRFLPLVFIVPILMYYFSQHKKLKDYAIFFLLILVLFSFNIPHLKYHGLNSMGETESWLSLATMAFTKWLRTPFIPYPNVLYYSTNIIRYFGFFILSIMILGLFYLYKKSKIKLLIFSLIFIIPFFTLSIQRYVLESAKTRIIIMSFLSLYILFAYGLLYLYNNSKNKKKLCLSILSLIVIIFLLSGFVSLIKKFDFMQDESFYDKKLLYQKETPEYYQFLKERFSEIRILPRYDVLGNKLNLFRKRNEEKAVIYNILKRDSLQGYKTNVVENIGKELDRKKNDFFNTDNYVILKINFDKLARNPNNAVSVSNEANNLFVDFQNEEHLLDIYYKELSVSWQQKILPLVVFPMVSDMYMTNEIYLDLNSFISYGVDEFGFEKVNSINYYFYKDSYDYAANTGMTAIPSKDNESEILIRIPVDSKIVIRNWFVNGANAQPFKIDGWIITLKEGEPLVKFYYNEPESYI